MPLFKKKKKEPEPEPDDIDADITEDDIDIDLKAELAKLDDDDEDLDDDKDDLGALENLDVEGYWNRRWKRRDDYMDNGGLMSTVYGEAGDKELQETLTMAEQDIIDLKLSMVPMNEGVKVGEILLQQFKSLRARLGLRVYSRLILGLRHSCTKEVKIGFHEPSFSEWDLPVEEWVDAEYLRRLQGIDIASADWKKGVAK